MPTQFDYISRALRYFWKGHISKFFTWDYFYLKQKTFNLFAIHASAFIDATNYNEKLQKQTDNQKSKTTTTSTM